jgi:hypothetical protein
MTRDAPDEPTRSYSKVLTSEDAMEESCASSEPSSFPPS